MKESKSEGCLAGLMVIILVGALALGWLLSVIKFVRCDFEPSYKAEAVYALGIFVPPIGGIVGYLDCGK